MNRSPRNMYQKLTRAILLASLVLLLLFGTNPSEVVNPASDELAVKVLNSVTILDSYFIARSGNWYSLQVLVKKNVDFVPVKIRVPNPSANYRILSLTPNPRETCPFAGRKAEEAGIIASLERGDLIAYDSYAISNLASFARTNRKLVDVIVDVQGDLFLVQRISVLDGCFWAQE